MKAILCFLLTCFCLQLQAQSEITLGTRHQLHSNVLGENREVWVSVPEKAFENPELRFPVVYVLDGQSYFHSFAGVLRHLSETNGNAMVPDMILVAVTNTNRNRDFTPSMDSSAGIGETGGAAAFASFLKQELIPFVEAQFPTAPHRLLVGHSLSGLFAMYAQLHSPDLFNSFILLDPSMWWDDMRLLKETPDLLDQTAKASNKTFLAIAHSLPTDMTTDKALLDTSYVSVGYRAAVELRTILQEKTSSVQSKSKYYPDESHGSVPLLGFYDGLRYLFDFYKRPSFALLTDDSPRILAEHYKNVSQKMGYAISPPERTAVGLAWRSRALEKNLDRAKAFLELAEKHYPNSVGLWYEWASYFQDLGDSAQAQTALAKARELDSATR